MRCESCGFENPPGMRFCGGCGAALPPSGAGAARAVRAPAEADRSAEHRQLTVMFCDLVDSTALSYRLEAEELREVVRSYQAIATRVIEAFDGHVAQFLGDGILAYFGFPVALEKEASQAARAGSGILQEVGALNERLERSHGVRVAVRIGLHTGRVVVGEVGAGGRREQLALGDAPNLAARIQSYAEPDSVVLSGETYRLVREEFAATYLGERRIRGIPSPVPLFSLGEEIPPAPAGAATPEPAEILVGRGWELLELRRRWARALRGEGQLVLIAGDPGIGKSALMRAFARTAEGAGAAVLRARCLPHFRNSPYRPLLELLERGAEGGAGLPPDVESLTPPRRTERIRSALLDFLLGASAERPVLLCLEDLQWADPSTLELVGLVAERVPGRRMLALLTHRGEFRPPWPPPPHQVSLALTRLPPADAERIMARVADGKRLPPVVAEEIVRRTDGVPLFVEELTRTVMESGLLRERDGGFELVGGRLPPFAIPATLHDSLEARLDRLAATKELAQVGAVIGREFPFRLLREVANVDEAALRASLAVLVDAGMLTAEGSPPDATYAFRHALIQETAYHSLLRGARQVYHLRVAQALDEGFPEEGAVHPELLAQHYAAAGQAEKAVEFWIRAGRRAVERSAVREAVVHLQQGLDLLLDLEPGRKRDLYELSLLLALGPALIATRGHAASDVRDLYLSARELAAAVGTPDQRFEVLGGLFTSRFVRSELDGAQELADELVRVAAVRGDDGSEMAARVATGAALLARGRLHHAMRNLDRGLELYDPDRHFALAHGVGQDFGVVALLYRAMGRAALGMPGLAAEEARRGLELARRLRHPHSLAFALAISCNVHHFLRRPAEVLPLLGELRELAGREGFDHWLVEVPALEAWALVELGRPGDGLAALAAEDGAGAPAAGEGSWVLRSVARWRLRGEAYLGAGRPEAALTALDRARTEGGEALAGIWWRSEVPRLRGCALALAGRPAEAEGELTRAVETARQAGSPSCLLRALTDLVRLARTPAARAALAEVYLGFAEGLDTPDLREARRVLDAGEPLPPLPLP